MCAGVMASCLGLLVFSRGASFDIYITATVACALACLFAADIKTNDKTSGAKRRAWAAGCYAWMGAALLAKGLIGVVLPAGIVAVYFVLRRRVPEGFWWRSLVWGVPLTLIVASVWYVPVIARHGWTFVDEFFIQHHFARYVTNKYRHPQPFYFYLPVIFALALPWSLLLVTAIIEAFKSVWRDERERATGDDVMSGDELITRLNLFALAWLVMPVVFFSLSGSKLPGYVLPALPGAAVLVGVRLMRGRARRDAWLVATGCLMSVGVVGGAVVAVRMEIVGFACALALAMVVVACGVAAVWWSHFSERAATSIIVATLVSIVITASCVAGGMGARLSLRDQLAVAAMRGYGDAPLYGLYTIERTAEFYHAGRIIYDAEGEPRKLERIESLVDAVRASETGRALIVTNREGLKQLEQSSEVAIETIGENDDVTLVGVKER